MIQYGDYKMSIGKRISDLRRKKNLTQEELAKKVEISRAALSHYEKDRRDPDYDTLDKIADVFEVSADYLIGRTNKKELYNKVTVAGQEIKLATDELKLFEELRKHPVMFHDLASDPENKVKELIKLYKMKKILLDEDDEEDSDGFGELDD